MLPPCELGAHTAREALKERFEVLRHQTEPLSAGTSGGIHDMRVASRRLRAALKEFKPLLEEPLRKPFERQVCAITRALGRPRELDVMIEMAKHWRGVLPGAGVALDAIAKALDARRKDALPHCGGALEIAGRHEFSEQFDALLQAIRPRRKCHVDQARRSLAKRLDAAGGAYDRWICQPENERLHELRIRCKKLRYACEIHAPHYPELMPGFLAHLKGLQDCLGRWNDVRVLIEEMAQLRPDNGCPWPDGGEVFQKALGEDERDKRMECEWMATDFFAPDTREAARHFLLEPEGACCLNQA